MTIKELIDKTITKQCSVENCIKHQYDKDFYWSDIDFWKSSSVCCRHCGNRVSIDQACQYLLDQRTNEKH